MRSIAGEHVGDALQVNSPPSVTPTELSRAAVMMSPWSAPLTSPAAMPQASPSHGWIDAGDHRDTAGEAHDARDRKVELPHQHRQAEPERHQAERGEQLHDAERRGDAEEIAGAAVHQRQHEDGARHDRERPQARPDERGRPGARAHSRSPEGVQHDHAKHDEPGDEILQLFAEAAQQQHDLAPPR